MKFAETLKGLTYMDTPAYDKMHALLSETLGEHNNGPLDWEDEFETLLNEEAKKKLSNYEGIQSSTGLRSNNAAAELTQENEDEGGGEQTMPQI